MSRRNHGKSRKAPQAQKTATQKGVAASSNAHDAASWLSVRSDVYSELHLMGQAKGDCSHPTPMTEFVLLDGQNVGVLSIRIPSDRPPTQLKNQGRHISAYTLMVEAVLARVSGSEVKEGLSLISTMLSEYIKDQELIAGYKKRMQEETEAKEKEIVSIDERMAFTRLLSDIKHFFANPAYEAIIAELLASESPEKRRFVRDFSRCKEESKAVLGEDGEDKAVIQSARNSIKRTGELAPYSYLINIAISLAIKTLNKMDNVAFEARRTKASSNEGSVISSAMTALKKAPELASNKVYKREYSQEIGKHIADLFDLPLVEIIDLSSTPDGQKSNAASLCRNLLRRHVKLVFDAFPNLRPAFNRPDELAKLLTPLLEKVRVEFGWGQLGKEGFFDTNKSLFAVVINHMELTQSSCLLDESRKFGAKRPKLPAMSTRQQKRQEAAQEAHTLHLSRNGYATFGAHSGVKPPSAKKQKIPSIESKRLKK